VTIPIGDARPGIVVPSLAVAPPEEGNVVLVVDVKGLARERVVQVGMRTPDGGIELRNGVAEGELMVVRGIEPLTEGAPVAVKSTLTLEQALRTASPPDDSEAAVPVPAGSGSASATGSGSAAGSGGGRRHGQGAP
jgi:hypothetical protein